MDAPLTLIRGCRVFDPTDRGIADVLIGGGSILMIAADIALDAMGTDVQRIDGGGQWLIPGLVDSLVHVSGGGGEGGFSTRTAALDAADAIAGGVTTLIGALGTDDCTRSLADLLASTRALGSVGLTGLALSGSYRVPVRTLTGDLRDDLVLIPDLIGVGEIAVADHRGSQPQVEELARIAADAHVGGLLSGKAGTVLIHVGDGDDRLQQLRAVVSDFNVVHGQFLPTHCNRSQALLDEAGEWALAGGTIDLTTSTSVELLAMGEVAAVDALAALLATPELVGRVTLSSDAQASLPRFDAEGRLQGIDTARIDSLFDTLRVAWFRHGLAVTPTLSAATLTPARVWGLQRKGRIAVGADADLLMVDPDRQRISCCIAGGRVHSCVDAGSTD